MAVDLQQWWDVLFQKGSRLRQDVRSRILIIKMLLMSIYMSKKNLRELKSRVFVSLHRSTKSITAHLDVW